MSKFDLELAKAGAAIQLRNGRPVKFVAHVPEANAEGRVVTLIDSKIVTYHEDGKWTRGGAVRPDDLIMGPVKHTFYVNVYSNGQTSMWATKEEAESYGSSDFALASAYPVEIELKSPLDKAVCK